MKKIDENFLHFLWKNQQLAGVVLSNCDNSTLNVIDPGIHNSDSGPDFFNAKIEIDNTLWAGNIELHINASDWIRHGHDNDPAYESVILHIVYFNDCIITRKSGEKIPAAVLRFPTLMWDFYKDLKKNKKWIPCQDHLRIIEPVHIAQWTSSLMVQKLQGKTEYLKNNLEDLQSHWDALLSRLIFRSFGVPVNTTPFEILSLTVPYTLLLRNKEMLFTLEAILFGQAGMLDNALSPDIYTENLKHEFSRFSGKLGANRVPVQSWKFMRMRPSSFPSVRIAQLATFIHKLFPFQSYLETFPDKNELFGTLRIKAGDYWNNHFQLGKESCISPKFLGKDFTNLLIINAIVPYLFFYGKMNNSGKYSDYALNLLEGLPAEDNSVLKKWGKFGIYCSNAFESQAILHLFNNYCKHKRCLECQFGNNIILDGI